MRRTMFRVLSQTAITYRTSPLSDGHAGRVHGGDRLPWVADVDNFAPLRSLDWQVHVYGRASDQAKQVAVTHGLPLRELAYTGDAETAGLERDAAYLVRPDGYVAVAAGPSARDVDDYARRRLERPLGRGDYGAPAPPSVPGMPAPGIPPSDSGGASSLKP